MERILESAIAAYENRGNARLPRAIDTVCPFCGRSLTFAISWSGGRVNRTLMFTEGRCSACDDKSTFVLVDLKAPESNKPEVGKLFIYPAAGHRSPLPDFADTEDVPDALARAYISAINVYNAGEWNAAATLVRRALEGVTKTQLPDESTPSNLASQLEALADHLELDKPLIGLAHALRKGGNLGAHFDLEHEADRQTASLMLDLLDYLLEYLYVLPGRVEKLDSRVERLPGAESAD